MHACKGCGLSIANVSERCLLQQAAVFFFVGDLVWPADLKDFLRQMLMKTRNFFM
ncbi:hypothetical protein DPMN_128969 [Dreissena polymorpha]|uniref:Uncharacterized protein n=1 Tax=Dreissena polymorpha TaxID=45954 RepID=A0A9D4H0E4_DREPO|nr:hypothetical protein DPMN_128969 [Dreissena polymorpha]